jgi:carbon monoxide dehydrogenase subunit G
MNVTGSTTLPASVDAVRAALLDPESLSRALPNVDAFGHTDGPDDGAGGSFAVTIRPAIALGEVPFRTVWRPVADDAAASSSAAAGTHAIRYRIEGRGDEQRFALDATVTLAEDSDTPGATRASWDLDCHFTGVLRAVGQRVLAPVVDRQVRDVLHAAATR